MRPPPARRALAVLALGVSLGLGGVACSKQKEQPTSPATSVSPDSSARGNGANTVPPGVSGQGSAGGQGTNGASP